MAALTSGPRPAPTTISTLGAVKGREKTSTIHADQTKVEGYIQSETSEIKLGIQRPGHYQHSRASTPMDICLGHQRVITPVEIQGLHP